MTTLTPSRGLETLSTDHGWTRIAADLQPVLRQHAARHDLDATFVTESWTALKQARMFSMVVPADLGGGGATIEELCESIRLLAHGCPSTALAFSMHSHLVAATTWRHLHGLPGEPLLRKVAAGELTLVSTGASDWIDANGEMIAVEGGFRVTGRKVFASGSAAGDILVTSARYGDRVLHFGVPFATEGVRVLNDWNTLGMRGTGSHTVFLEDVFVPTAAVSVDRAAGEWHKAWSVVATIAIPTLMSAYVGVAEAAAAEALENAHRNADAPHMPYLLGEMENHLTACRLAWEDGVRRIEGFDVDPTPETANASFIRKTLCAEAAVATVEKALEVSGGRGFFRTDGRLLEQLVRDVRGAAYHPLPAKRQQMLTGRLALGLPPV